MPVTQPKRPRKPRSTELIPSPEKAERISAAASVELVLECAIEMCAVSETYVDTVCDDASGFQKAIKSFILLYGVGVGKFLTQRMESAPFCLCDLVNELVREYKPQGKELVQQIISRANPFAK